METNSLKALKMAKLCFSNEKHVKSFFTNIHHMCGTVSFHNSLFH